MNISFKWYTLVKKLREQLKHVDGLEGKQEILTYYIDAAENQLQSDLSDFYVLPCHFSYTRFEHFFSNL